MREQIVKTLLQLDLIVNPEDVDNPGLLNAAVEKGYLENVEDLLNYGADVNMLERPRFGESLTPLHSAVKSKQVEMVELLINYGANVNIKGGEGTIPLVYAIGNRDTEMSKLLLSHGADIKEDPNLLCAAVMNGSLKIVEALLQHGADVNMLYNSRFGESLTPLHSAVKSNQLEMAKLLINYEADVNIKDGDGTSPIVDAIQNMATEMSKLLLINRADIKEDPNLLCTAITNGSLKIVRQLLKYGADVNMVGSSKFGESLTPLHSAVKSKQVEMVELLINYGANVNIKSGEGTIPLVYAIGNRDTEMTKLLLSRGADIKEDPNLLCAAVMNGSLEIVENLLQHGANVNMLLKHSNFGRSLTPLHSAVKSKQLEMAKLLIHYGADVNMVERIESLLCCTPLHSAVNNKQLEMAKLLLQNGADVNMLEDSEFEGFSPLHSAITNNQVEMVKLLIKYGANVNGTDGYVGFDDTPIFCAILISSTEIFKLLLINGARVKHIDILLDYAVDSGNVEIVEALLRHGADINSYSLNGITALHYTVLGHWENERRLKSSQFGSDGPMDHPCCTNDVAELLLSKGANVNAVTKSGITTLCAASQKGYEDIVETLLKYGAECDPKDEKIIKPLHAAAMGGHQKIIENLLKFGAEVDSRDIYGRTALHFASREGHIEIVKTLLEYGSDVNIISIRNHTPLEYGKFFEDVVSDEDDEGYQDDDYHYNLGNDDDYNSDNDDYHYNLDNYENFCQTNDSPTTKLLKQHIAKMKTAGLHVSDRNLLWISNDHEINNFVNECEAEIEIMKTEKIDKCHVSFYDILTKNTRQLAKNESIVQALKSDDCKTKFPIYAGTIDGRFRRAVQREELLEQVRDKILKSLPKLPLLCTEEIFSYLSDKDLRILLVDCKP